MTLRRPSEHITAFFLLLVLGGNFFLSIFWPQWHTTLPWHDHIILGPVYPGWEHHHHENLGRPAGYTYSHTPATSSSAVTIQAGLAGMAPGGSKVISLYRLPAGDVTVVGFGVQLLWLARWAILAEPTPLTWPVDLTTPVPANTFLSPPDKPPILHL